MTKMKLKILPKWVLGTIEFRKPKNILQLAPHKTEADEV